MSSGILGPPNADVATPLATPNCCSQKCPCKQGHSESLTGNDYESQHMLDLVANIVTTLCPDIKTHRQQSKSTRKGNFDRDVQYSTNFMTV